MSLEDADKQAEIEVPPDWQKCTLRNCPYYLTLSDYPRRNWDEVYCVLMTASGTSLQHTVHGPCRKPCETSGPISPHDVILTRGSEPNNNSLKKLISKLVASMPEIEVDWE